VAQHIAHGDARKPRMIAKIIRAPVLQQRDIQRHPPLLHQLHHQIGEHRLAQRCIFKHRSRGYGGLRLRVGHANPAAPGHRAVLDHRDANTGHRERLHHPR